MKLNALPVKPRFIIQVNFCHSIGCSVLRGSKTKLIHSLLLSLLFCSSSYGQALFSKADQRIPVTGSPEAISLGKYGDTPVSLFSGLVDVSIPMYTFKVGDISVPIKLSYNAGGIRVDDIATDVGLGWSLNAGGIIAKGQHGGPDGTNNLLMPGNDFDPHGKDYSLAEILVEEGKDLERDIYYYNFLNFSGKFMIRPDGKPSFFPANPNLKVDLNENVPPIIITDDNGFKYYFTIIEASKNTPTCSVGIPGPREYPDAAITAFYLTKIISPNNNVVDFLYEDYSYKVIKNYNEVIYVNDGALDCPSMVNQNRKCNIIQEYFGKRIKRISSPGLSNSVEFVYSSVKRLDLKFENVDQGNHLDQINIKRDNIVHKSWNLSYSYFGKDSNLRLKLLSVKEDSTPPYEFLYDEVNAMPERLSFSQDIWGFYNGKTITNTFIPPVPSMGRLLGADREPDFEYMKTYTLNSIKYPTGGHSAFEFEPHQDFVTEDVTTFVKDHAGVSNTSGGQVDFFIPLNSLEFKLSWSLPTINHDDQMIGYILGGPNLTTVLKSVSGSGVETSFSNLPTNANYRLAFGSSNVDDIGDIYFEWSKPVTVTTSYNKILFGGLRVKSIKTYDKAVLIGSKYYNYNKVKSPTESSIVLPSSAFDARVFYGVFSAYKIKYMENHSYLDGDCGYKIFYSSSPQSISSALDNSIGYSEVTESNDLNNGNGRTIYRFFTDGLPGSRGALIEKIDQKLSADVYQNTHRLKNIYEESSPRDTLVSMKINYWRKQVILNLGQNTIVVPSEFELQKNLDISAKLLLKETNEISYGVNGDSVISSTKYKYENALHGYPTVIEKFDSKQRLIVERRKYVLEMWNDTALPVYSAMRQANIIAPLIEENLFNESDNLSISNLKNNYMDFGNNIYQPASVVRSYGTNAPVTEVTYHNYDNTGNLLTYSKLNGIYNSFKWGYNNQYVIAECKNSGLNNFFYEGFEEASSLHVAVGSVDSPSHTGERYYLGNYTVSWVIPDAKNYVIAYWYRSGGKWNLHKPSPYTVNNLLLSGGDAYDDIRIYPVDAEMKTYTYTPLVGITSSTDSKFMVEYYEYDNFNRLKNVKDQSRNVIKNYAYHY